LKKIQNNKKLPEMERKSQL